MQKQKDLKLKFQNNMKVKKVLFQFQLLLLQVSFNI